MIPATKELCSAILKPLQYKYSPIITIIPNLRHDIKRFVSSVDECTGTKAIEGRVAMITGAAQGIGYNVAEALLNRGAKMICLVDKLEKEVQQSTTKLKRIHGERVKGYILDITKPDHLPKLYECILCDHNQLDIVMNNAGMFADAFWEDCIKTNINALVQSSFLAFKHMGVHEKGKGGIIINTASIFGLNSFPPSPVSSASKHFVVGFTRAMGSDYFYNLTKVKMMAVSPGVTTTYMASHEEIARTALKGFGDVGKILNEGLDALPKQPPEAIAKCVMKMLETQINGTVWVCENQKIYKTKEIPRECQV